MSTDPRDYTDPTMIGGPLKDAADPNTPDPIRAASYRAERIGTPLRDAAVDPRPGDHLPPSNAGVEGEQGNPHGPNATAPEVGP